MERRIVLAVLFVCLGASAFVAEARTHEKFSTTSYYEPKEPATTIVAPKDGSETSTTTGPKERYPHGHYPGQTHVWNPVTEKYESVNGTEDAPKERYPLGHYPGQTHIWNATTEKYESVNGTDDTPQGRYPLGHYPGQTHIWNATTEKYETVNGTENAPVDRYPRGHYPGQTHIWNPTTEKYETVNGTNEVPQGRYPHGHYPGQTHIWNATTEKYEAVSGTDDAPQERYPHGHYPGQTHTWNATSEKYETVSGADDVPQERYPHGHYPGQTHIWNPTTEKYETVNGTDDVPQGRYPHGHYPGQTHIWNPVTEKYETVNSSGSDPVKAGDNSTNPSEGRYEHGYWGRANYNYSEGDTLTTVKAPGSSYTEGTKSDETTVEGTQNRYPAGYNNGHSGNPTSLSATEPDETTFDPVEGRYKFGYYSSSSYAGSDTKPTRTTVGESLAAENSTTDSGHGERYPSGYYPESEYSKQSVGIPKVTTYASAKGDFNTLPYSSTSGVPYVPNGAGCRTAYWADHPSSWPSFLNIKSTVGDAFGEKATEVYGETTILQALLKYGSDPYSELLRSACAALLNSYGRGKFSISHIKVIEEFNAALVSKEAAAKQAIVFETANVESISAGNACT